MLTWCVQTVSFSEPLLYNTHMDILIVGGGASGLMAALSASANEKNNITVLERQDRVGRKLLATGNGRCNITNTNASGKSYHGENPSFASYALEQFGPADTLSYFESLGLICREMYGGRVYPLSDSANSVLDVLRFACIQKGINIATGTFVEACGFKNGRFYAYTSKEVYSADRLIVACGGKAGGKLGGTGDGYSILKSFGHKCTKLYPSLVPVFTNDELTRSLKGVRAEVEIRLNGIKRQGELQFVEKGISGPAAFDISREAAIKGGEISIDFLTGDVSGILKMRRENMPSLECGSILTGIVHNRLSIALVKYCGIKPSLPVSELTDDDIASIALACRCFKLNIKGVGNFDSAQITVGGISTRDFDSHTMGSLLVPGLYACGEVLDIDGDCGGYNLQWAWSSGFLAGQIG